MVSRPPVPSFDEEEDAEEEEVEFADAVGDAALEFASDRSKGIYTRTS